MNCLPLKPSRSAAFAENFSGCLHRSCFSNRGHILKGLEHRSQTGRAVEDRQSSCRTYSFVPMLIYEDLAKTPLPPANSAASSNLLLFMTSLVNDGLPETNVSRWKGSRASYERCQHNFCRGMPVPQVMRFRVYDCGTNLGQINQQPLNEFG